MRAGSVLAVLEIPELQSQITRKELEIAETEASLRLLHCGTRPEILAEQLEKIARATQWRDLAKHDLELARKSFQSEISAFKFRVERANNDLSYRTTIVGQAKQLYERAGWPANNCFPYNVR